MTRNPELDVDPQDIPLVVAAAAELDAVTETVARNLGGWLVVVAAGLSDNASPDTRARFRRILRELGAAGALPPPPSAARRRALARRIEASSARAGALAAGRRRRRLSALVA